MRRNKYTVGNEAYVIPAIFIILVLSCLSLDMLYVCMNICFTIFFMAVTSIVHTPVKKIIAGITSIFVFIIIIFIGSLYEGKNLHYAGFSLTQLFYFIGLWVTVFYISLIRNVTPLGKKTFEYLNGFREFLKTAEINRIIASDPKDKERVFCEYLPYAFAMDLYSQWMKKFTYILSKAAIDQHLASMRDVDAVSYRLRDIFQIIDNRGSNLKR